MCHFFWTEVGHNFYKIWCFLTGEWKFCSDWMKKQDDRLAPTCFLPNYKFFDQLLQTAKNKTTVLNLLFKVYLQTSIPPLISAPDAKGYHDFPLEKFDLTVPKTFVEEPFYIWEKIRYRKKLRIKEGAGIMVLSKMCSLTVPKKFLEETLCASEKFW